jgi:RNA polymerase sigma-70 factor (ECF subfamily)
VDTLDDLVDRARRGDPEGFAGLYELLAGPIYRYLAAQVEDAAEVEDMTAEVFAEAARRIRRFRGDGAAFMRWLFTVARNDLRDHGRREARRRTSPVPDPPDREDPAPRPDELVIARLEARRAVKALEDLTPHQREVLLLRFAAGLGLAETAAALGKPVTAVKSLQHRGLVAIRRRLEKGP